MFEAFVDPDCTALITASERLPSLAASSICNKSMNVPHVLVDREEDEDELRLMRFSAAPLLEKRTKDNKKRALMMAHKITVFFVFISL